MFTAVSTKKKRRRSGRAPDEAGARASPVFQACQDPAVLYAGAVSSALQASHLACLQSAPRS